MVGGLVFLGSISLKAGIAIGGATFEFESLDGRGNNKQHPDQGAAGQPLSRVAEAHYADGIGAMLPGPNSRMISNRVFNDIDQNIFSENGVSRWGAVWGQFIDHDIGHRDEAGEQADIAFPKDPLESFPDPLGKIAFSRSKAAPGTGIVGPREQTNTVSSYIDASQVYGVTADRLEFLRAGPVDGKLDNNSALLMLPGGQLPPRDARGNPAKAPDMVVDGRLLMKPARAAVAGDVRANENIELTATQTLFAREHNRIVSMLPNTLTDEQKFQVARRVVIAEMQFITYTEFLPAMGVKLPAFKGYDPNVDAAESNEFSTVGFRGHSIVHGTVDVKVEADRFTPAEDSNDDDASDADSSAKSDSSDGDSNDEATASASAKPSAKPSAKRSAKPSASASASADAAAKAKAGQLEMQVPMNLASFNPDLLPQLQLGQVLKGIGSEPDYRNDEMIDNQMRSVLFQLPTCRSSQFLDVGALHTCFKVVLDLGALDIERARDHGMPLYNQMRMAFGLPPKKTFESVTGEASSAFPADPMLTAGNEINDPHISLCSVRAVQPIRTAWTS